MIPKRLFSSSIPVVVATLVATAVYADSRDDWDEGYDFNNRANNHRRHDAVPPSAFEFVTIRVERNATDGDTEIVIAAKPDSDEGLVNLTVRSPDRRRVVNARSPILTGGLREFLFESPEPVGDAILGLYPEGTYQFFGRTANGERFYGETALSHLLPPETVIIYPMQDQVVGSDSLTIQWSSVPSAAEFMLEFENESVDPQQVLTLNLPAGSTSFEVPASLLVPGADYQVGLSSVAEDGNFVGVEVQFSTAE